MKTTAIRQWSWIHKWSSLVCTLFLLMLCLTGLPLVFHDEIDDLSHSHDWQAAHPDGPRLTLDEILATALNNRPDEVPLFMSFDIERPVVNVTTALASDLSVMHFAPYDATSGAAVPTGDHDAGFMAFLLQLHTDMFLGLPGMLFLGLMGFLFIIATISGVILYVPFMSRLAFGTVRRQRSARVKWLDYHNLLGVVTLVWALVVCFTGVINTLEVPIIDAWQEREVRSLISAHQEAEVGDRRASLDDAVNAAKALAPDMKLQFVAFPGSSYSTHAHYSIFLHGNTPLSEHVITPVMVRVDTGEVVGLREMPIAAKALSLSRPLHFGDYGGLPLKLLWVLLTLIMIVILISGLYLWWGKRSSIADRETVELAYAGSQG